jgi:hypothetical protein
MNRGSRTVGVACGLIVAATFAPAIHAQIPPTHAVALIDQRPDDGPLSRIIRVRLDEVPIRDALETIARIAELRLTYSPAQVVDGPRVSLDAERITVGNALQAVLHGTGLEAIALPSGRISVGPRVAAPGQVMAERVVGSISGFVLDSTTRQPVAYASVLIEETRQGTTVGPDGRYTITGVAAGEYRVTARRLGYVPKTRPVTVADGQVTTLDFALNQPPTKLDEVVTTAVGDQRRYQVGNTIATINADSIAPTAPITSLTDLISSTPRRRG